MKHLNGQVVMDEEPFVVGPNQETTPVIITIVSKKQSACMYLLITPEKKTLSGLLWPNATVNY